MANSSFAFFELWGCFFESHLVESVNAEPVDAEGRLN